MKLYYSLILIFFFSSCYTSKYDLVLNNIRIIDTENGDVKECNLAIEGNLISKISTKKLSGIKSIDLDGRYIVPPLNDLHVHIHGDKSKLEEFYENGVWTVRDMGAFNKAHIDSLKKWQNTFDLVEINLVGWIHSDSGCYNGHRHIELVKDIEETVKFTKDIGADFYKIHNCFPINLLHKLDSLTETYNIRITGHIPEGIDPIEYCKLNNVATIEHISILVRALLFRNKEPMNMTEAITLLDGSYLDSLAATMKIHDIAFTPNLLSEKEFLKSYPIESRKKGEALFKRYLSYTKRIADHGVLILAGTDTGLGTLEAGSSLHEELQLLSSTGLNNLKVLQSATINANKLYNTKLREVKVGEKADFIIINGNPLEDITYLRIIYGQVHSGILKINSQIK